MFRAFPLIAAVSALGCVDLDRPSGLEMGGDGGSGQVSQVDAPVDAPDPDPDAAMSAPSEPDGSANAPEMGAVSDAAGPGDAMDAPSADGGTPADAPVDSQGSIDSVRDGVGVPDGGVDAGGAMDLRPAGDTLAALIVDDFADQNVARNRLGGEIISENQNVALVGGEVTFSWNGDTTPFSQAFAQNLSLGGCPVDVGRYRTLSFRMRASAPGKVVFLVTGRSAPLCEPLPMTLEIGNFPLTTTMTTYTIDLTAVPRSDVRFFQWVLSADSTRYFMDDIQLLP